MLVYVFSILAACTNATSSVLQRKAERKQPLQDMFSPRLILQVAREPAWLAGIGTITAGFLLQAAALSNGALAVVEPILVLELPITLVLAMFVFRQPMHKREWLAIAAMTAGLAGLLYFLSPHGGHSANIGPLTWGVGIAVNIVVVGALVFAARNHRAGDMGRPALLGTATGAMFGLTAALTKAMTEALSRGGAAGLFTAWQTYGVVACGIGAMFLLQSALDSGPLIAAQPGFTAADPIVSILWGVLAFGEQVRGGWFLALAFVSAAVLGWGIYVLSRSSALDSAPSPSDDEESGDERAADHSPEPS